MCCSLNLRVEQMKKKDILSFVLYKPFTLESASTRPGALNILKMPSRFHNTLYYPNGKVVYDKR